MEVLYIFVGWLLGLISPQLTERIQRSKKQKEILKAITGETRDLRVRLAWIVLFMKASLLQKALPTEGPRCVAEVNSVLTWMDPIIRSFPAPEDEMFNAGLPVWSDLFSRDESERAKLVFERVHPAGVSGFKRQSLPFVMNIMGDLSLFPVPVQRHITNIVSKLDLLNQDVDELISLEHIAIAENSENRNEFLNQQFERGFTHHLQSAHQLAQAITAFMDSLDGPDA